MPRATPILLKSGPVQMGKWVGKYRIPVLPKATVVQPSPPSKADGTLSIIGIVFGLLSIGFFPVVFGPLGIIFGALDYRDGVNLGFAAIVISIAGLILGMWLGVMLEVKRTFA